MTEGRRLPRNLTYYPPLSPRQSSPGTTPYAYRKSRPTDGELKNSLRFCEALALVLCNQTYVCHQPLSRFTLRNLHNSRIPHTERAHWPQRLALTPGRRQKPQHTSHLSIQTNHLSGRRDPPPPSPSAKRAHQITQALNSSPDDQILRQSCDVCRHITHALLSPTSAAARSQWSLHPSP